MHGNHYRFRNSNDSLPSSQLSMSRAKVLDFTFSSIAVLFMIVVVASCKCFKVRKHRLVNLTQTHSMRNLPETQVIFNVEGDYCRIILDRRLPEIPINRDNSVNDEEYERIIEYDCYRNGTYVSGTRCQPSI